MREKEILPVEDNFDDEGDRPILTGIDFGSKNPDQVLRRLHDKQGFQNNEIARYYPYTLFIEPASICGE